PTFFFFFFLRGRKFSILKEQSVPDLSGRSLASAGRNQPPSPFPPIRSRGGAETLSSSFSDGSRRADLHCSASFFPIRRVRRRPLLCSCKRNRADLPPSSISLKEGEQNRFLSLTAQLVNRSLRAETSAPFLVFALLCFTMEEERRPQRV
ncbi:unnamed protein product, partial [Musa acuminata subsp. malaccensis]